MEDGQPTSTPTPCKMGCGFFVSFVLFVSLFPVRFPASPPRYRVVAESVRPLLSRVTLMAPRTPGPRNSEAFRGLPCLWPSWRRLCSPPRLYNTRRGHGVKAHFQTRSVALNHTRIGPYSSPSFRADSSYSQHGTDRAWGRVERGSPQPLRGDQKEGYGRRIGQGSWRVGLGRSIRFIRSAHFHSRRRHKSLSFVGQALKNSHIYLTHKSYAVFTSRHRGATPPGTVAPSATRTCSLGRGTAKLTAILRSRPLLPRPLRPRQQ